MIKRAVSHFKSGLLLFGVIVLTGCSKAPDGYQRAAERYAEDNCEGVVTKVNTNSFGVTQNDVILNTGFRYTCVGDNGTVSIRIPYKDIPVKYFEEK